MTVRKRRKSEVHARKLRALIARRKARKVVSRLRGIALEG